ncbi:hypothetical protein ACXZ65_39035 [Streptomyces aculeolatus]
MSRIHPARCIGPDPSGRRQMSASDVVIVVVVTVLACVLAAFGMPPSAILGVLGGAGLVAVGVLIALRADSGLGRLLVRVVQASSPA